MLFSPTSRASVYVGCFRTYLSSLHCSIFKLSHSLQLVYNSTCSNVLAAVHALAVEPLVVGYFEPMCETTPTYSTRWRLSHVKQCLEIDICATTNDIDD